MTELGSAAFSADGAYRYLLCRRWGAGADHVLFVMLNPSTADATTDDPTIRRCVGFAKAWNYSGLTVANLFALRATHPSALYETPLPIDGAGDDNAAALELAANAASAIVVAWGTHAAHWPTYTRLVVDILRGAGRRELWCLGHTKARHPKHPLYLAADTELVRFDP